MPRSSMTARYARLALMRALARCQQIGQRSGADFRLMLRAAHRSCSCPWPRRSPGENWRAPPQCRAACRPPRRSSRLCLPARCAFAAACAISSARMGKWSLNPPNRNHSRRPACSILIQPIISRLPVATPSSAPLLRQVAQHLFHARHSTSGPARGAARPRCCASLPEWRRCRASSTSAGNPGLAAGLAQNRRIGAAVQQNARQRDLESRHALHAGGKRIPSARGRGCATACRQCRRDRRPAHPMRNPARWRCAASVASS